MVMSTNKTLSVSKNGPPLPKNYTIRTLNLFLSYHCTVCPLSIFHSFLFILVVYSSKTVSHRIFLCCPLKCADSSYLCAPPPCLNITKKNFYLLQQWFTVDTKHHACAILLFCTIMISLLYFLATLVALHFPPVSEWVSQS